jgi:hypothetical protein
VSSLVSRVASRFIAALLTSSGAALVGYINSAAGSVYRTVLAKLTDSLWVEDFGAVGDGVTNDGPALQAAIDSGRRVRMRDVTYATTQTLIGRTRMSLIGGIRERTIIKATAAMTCVLSFPSGNIYSNVTLKRFKLDANALAPRCLEMIAATQGVIDGIEIDIAARGATTTQVYLEKVEYFTLKLVANGGTIPLRMVQCFTGDVHPNSVIYNGSTYVVSLEDCAKTSVVGARLFNNPPGSGGTNGTAILRAKGGRGVTIERCIFEPQGAGNVTAEVILEDIPASDMAGFRFINNSFEGVGDTKTACVILGDSGASSGSVFNTLFEFNTFIKPAAGTTMLWYDQYETRLVANTEKVAYATAIHADVSITYAGASPYYIEDLPGVFRTAIQPKAGIKFAAAQVSSADPNTLDDYQEENVTLTITGSTGNPTTPTAVGGFDAPLTKVGRFVHLKHNFGAVNWAAPGTGTFRINLPFAVNGMAKVQGTLFTTAVVGEMNGTILTLYPVGSGTALTWAAIAAGGSLIIDITGQAAT